MRISDIFKGLLKEAEKDNVIQFPGGHKPPSVASGGQGYKLGDEEHVTVPGIGTFAYDMLKDNVRKKLEDMIKRLDSDELGGVKKAQLDALFAMWTAMQNHKAKR